MKIIRTIDSFYPFVTGPANQAFFISNSLEEHGIESPIITTFCNVRKSPAKEKLKSVNVKRFKDKFKFLQYYFTPAIKQEFVKNDFDLVHSHNYRNYQCEIGFKYAKKFNKPFVLSLHGSLVGYRKSVSGLKQIPYKLYDLFRGNKILKNTDAFIVNSNREYDEAVEYGLDAKKIHIIPVGITPSSYYVDRTNRDSDIIRLLFVGNISRNRHLEPIITALARLDKKYELYIVGGEMKSSKLLKSGYLTELRKLTDELGVSERVKFVGPKYNNDLIKQYQNADIFIYTSLSENFGQTILEAAASGLPLICTDVGIVKELVDETTGVVISDYGKVAQAAEMFEEKSKRIEAGKKLKQIVEKKYNKENIKMRYEKIYLGLLKK